MPTLQSIENAAWPNVVLRCENQVEFDGFMNDRNRFKLDRMTEFPELIIDDCNTQYGMLKSGNIEVIVYLERRS